jgi:Flp pilus assembly pilin Flp
MWVMRVGPKWRGKCFHETQAVPALYLDLPHWEDALKNFLAKLWKDEEAQDLTEYALLLVLLSLAAVGALSGLATAINGTFANATTNLTT